jgi:hypothetical protein
MVKASTVAVVGLLGVGAYVLWLNRAGIADIFKAGGTAAQTAGTTAGAITGTAGGIVALPYTVGTTIGGELGTAFGNILNFARDVLDVGAQQQRVTTAAQTQALQTATSISTAVNPSGAQVADIAYIQAQMADLQVSLNRGLITPSVYQSISTTLQERLARYQTANYSIRAGTTTAPVVSAPSVSQPVSSGATTGGTVSLASTGLVVSTTRTATSLTTGQQVPRGLEYAQVGSPAYQAAVSAGLIRP